MTTAPTTSGATVLGTEWLVEAWGCDAERLRSQQALSLLFTKMIEELLLQPVAASQWHVFPGAGGVTGMQMLAESHLTCHSFPEAGLLTLNLYCCRPRPAWPFADRLAVHFGASNVEVRVLPRGGPPLAARP